MSKVKDFFISKKQTMTAITWTKPKDLMKNWIIVVLFTIFFTSALFGVDLLISYILKLIVNLL